MAEWRSKVKNFTSLSTLDLTNMLRRDKFQVCGHRLATIHPLKTLWSTKNTFNC